MKTIKTTKILGRNYMDITRVQADTLEFLRVDCFEGKIDSNTCEKEAYKFIFDDNMPTHQDGEIFGLVKRTRDMDVGAIWIANHSRKTITYDGIRSLRVAEELKRMPSENPPLLSSGEYRDLIEYYSKFYGVFYYRPENKISIEEFEAAKKTIELYEKQLLLERRSREPELGDTVRCLNGSIGRYVGSNQVLYVCGPDGEISRDLVDMDVDWDNLKNEPLPSDSDLLKCVRENPDFID